VIWLGHRVFLSAFLTENRSARQENSYAILRIPKNPYARQNRQIMKEMILKTLALFNISLRNSTNHAVLPRASLLIPLLIGCLALLPKAQAAPEKGTTTPDATANPHRQVIRMPAAPEMALAGFNTADGDHALFSITTGVANTAVGWYSLFANTDGSFNTAVGAGTLILNIGDQTTGEGLDNTAVGAAALLFNTTGSSNTGLGVLALENNNSGGGNTATGLQALQNNTTGSSNSANGVFALLNNQDGLNNAAFGIRPLELNTSGNNNTAIGNLALQNSQGSDNVALGRHAGDGLTTANNNIVIGHGSGISTTNGQVDDSCYIGNIIGAGVDAGTAAIVFVDQDGKLGTTALPNTGNLPNTQAFSGRVQELETTVAQQAKAIEVLTAQLKEQATQIQKVSAQLEVSKPATKVVSHKQ
jgi:hypothetical protein